MSQGYSERTGKSRLALGRTCGRGKRAARPRSAMATISRIRNLPGIIWEKMSMHYLVTGGAGFIGSNIVDELVRRGHRVTVLDDLSAGKERNLEAVRGRIDFVRGSVTDRE